MNLKTRGVIAAGHPKTAEAGAEMLRLGGNAFDAAVAAVFAAFVTASVLTSPAGGGFLLAHTSQGNNILFDFFTQTPKQKLIDRKPHFYPIEADFGNTTQEFHVGLGSIAAPGNLGGLMHVHRRLGRLPLKAVVEPAVHHAQAGIELDPFRAYCLQLLAPILTANLRSREIYAPQGTLLQSGDILRIPDLATTLSDLVETGPSEFYQGDIAHQIARDCQEKGGYLRLADLAQYQVIERSPLAINYRDHVLLTNPPPSSGGALIGFALELLSQMDFSDIPYGGRKHLQILAQAMRLTNEARRDGYDAKLYEANIAASFLSASHLDHYRQTLSSVTHQWGANKWGSTTHISVIDSEGNAASVTSSNGEGSSYIIPDTGIMMNNMLGEEDLNPYGFHQWRPDQRISSMMAPTIVLKDNQPQIVLGSGGSNRIRTAILQVISGILDFQMPVEAAVNAPRVHWERGVFHLEPGFSRTEIDGVAGIPGDEQVWWQERNMFFGGVHTVVAQPNGQITGAGDPRRGGAVVLSCNNHRDAL